MTWSEFLSNLLQSTHKVDKAAVFNLRGQPVATSQDLQITEADGKALLRCLDDNANNLTCVHIDGMDFRCFRGTNDAVIGTSTSNKGRVLVARRAEEALVVVMGDSGTHGSFLFELQKNLLERARQQQVSIGRNGEQQLQQTTSQTQLQFPQSPVRKEDVLISLEN